jgi:hypothetical protein
MQNKNVSGPFASQEENEVLLIWPSIDFFITYELYQKTRVFVLDKPNELSVMGSITYCAHS